MLFKKTNIAFLLTTVLAIVFVTGCMEKSEPESETEQKSPSTMKQLVYGTEQEIEQINPVINEVGHSEIDNLIFRGLTKPTEDNEATGDLALEWEVSDDLLTYTFTLRDDAVWEDGHPVTAEDVKFTFDKILDPSVNTPNAGDFSEVKEVNVVSNNQVQIILHNPFPSILNKLRIGIIPKIY